MPYVLAGLVVYAILIPLLPLVFEGILSLYMIALLWNPYREWMDKPFQPKERLYY